MFSVISAIGRWPSWNPDVKSVSAEGPVQPGTVFRWKAGPSSLTSILQVVDPGRDGVRPAARRQPLGSTNRLMARKWAATPAITSTWKTSW